MHKDSRVIFFDLETGGLNSYRHPIIQLGAAAVSWGTLEIVEELNCKLQFNTQDCEPKALEVNCYDPAAWKDAVPLLEALDRFAHLCRQHACVQKTSKNGKPYSVAQPIAYRADFDMGFIKQAFKNANLFLPASYNAFCVMQRAYWFYAEHPSVDPPEDFKLTSVCQALGVQLDNAHDAGADNRAQIAVLKRMRNFDRPSATGE